MRFEAVNTYTAILAGLLSPALAAGGCNNDNCERAVTGTRRGETFVASAKADCTSFMVQTVTAPGVSITSTVTVAAGEDQATEVPVKRSESIPWYASACSDASRYSSACSCWGVTGQTITVTPTETVISTVTATAPPGTTYTPDVPTSYESCVYDPESQDAFELLDPNTGLPIIKNGSLAMVVQEASDPWVPVRYNVVKPAGTAANVYDLTLQEGGVTYYLAVYESGKVGFTTSSSNGQTYVDSDGGMYITSVFSFTCKGRLQAGILNGLEFHFAVTDDKRIVARSAPPAASKRDIPVPEGFYVIPANIPKPPPGERCSAGQSAVSNGLTPTANGCGAKDGVKVPDFNFGSCCDGHDICYGTCSQDFATCNNDFYGCMLQQCAPLSPFSPLLALACNGVATTYYLAVRFWGDDAFAAATDELCDCKCDDASLTACGDKCVDTKTDVDNCGSCNFHCPSGACKNGACAFDSCAGSVCGAFGSCGPGGSCVCASIAGGDGFCVNGDTPCDGLADCGTSADCPLGSVCAVGSCCGRNVCITTDYCGGYNTNVKRAWVNATIAEPGNWVQKF